MIYLPEAKVNGASVTGHPRHELESWFECQVAVRAERLGQFFEGQLLVGVNADAGGNPHCFFSNHPCVELSVLD
jgi:hypothetical protein